MTQSSLFMSKNPLFALGRYNKQCILLPPSAVPHISQPPVSKSRRLTASPRGEKLS